jgi:hypothetical protein
MPDQNRKSKMISVRVSREEYELLKASYEARGIRSVSELARDAMQHFLNHDNGNTEASQPHGDCEAKIRFLDARLNSLQGELAQLSRLVANNLVRKES